MARNLLTDSRIKSARLDAIDPATGKPLKRLNDGDGLFLLLQADGLHRWRFSYVWQGRDQMLSFGNWPDTGLKSARRKAMEAREMLGDGKNPSQERKAERQQRAVRNAETSKAEHMPGTFAHTALDLHATKLPTWTEFYAAKWLWRLEKHAFPTLGRKQLKDITREDMRQICQRLSRAGTLDTAHTVRQNCSQVFKWGIALEVCDADPAAAIAPTLTEHTPKNMAALETPQQVAVLMRAIYDYRKVPTRAALILIAHTFQRPGNIRFAEWAHFDLDKALWTIPSKDMKRKKKAKATGKAHVVPLARQVVEVLRELQQFTGDGRYLFPSIHTRERPMSDATINKALRLMGYEREEMTGHGFRAMAQTIIRDELDIDNDLVEAQMAHIPSGPLGDIYYRSEFVNKRAEMAQKWADYLEQLRKPPLKLAA